MDELVIDGRQFFLMEHEQYGNSAAFAVVDANGKIAAEDTYNGFDESVISQIRQFMHPQVSDQVHNTSGQLQSEKKTLENWQKPVIVRSHIKQRNNIAGNSWPDEISLRRSIFTPLHFHLPLLSSIL